MTTLITHYKLAKTDLREFNHCNPRNIKVRSVLCRLAVAYCEYFSNRF